MASVWVGDAGRRSWRASGGGDAGRRSWRASGWVTEAVTRDERLAAPRRPLSGPRTVPGTRSRDGLRTPLPGRAHAGCAHILRTRLAGPTLSAAARPGRFPRAFTSRIAAPTPGSPRRLRDRRADLGTTPSPGTPRHTPRTPRRPRNAAPTSATRGTPRGPRTPRRPPSPQGSAPAPGTPPHPANSASLPGTPPPRRPFKAHRGARPSPRKSVRAPSGFSQGQPLRVRPGNIRVEWGENPIGAGASEP